MKKIIALCLGLVMTAGICFSDPVEGFWVSVDDKTGQDTAGWELYQQNGKLYGKVLSTAGYPQDVKAVNCKESYRDFPLQGKVNQMPIVGTPWIFGLVPDRSGQWKDGHVIDTRTGNMYKCRVTYHAADGNRFKTDTMEMRGEIGLGIGMSVFWRKCTQAEAVSFR
jgi:uncharacterized protein (DUF2147 family)